MRLSPILHRDAVPLELQRGTGLARGGQLGVKRFAPRHRWHDPVQRRPRLLAYGLFRIAREKFLITVAIHLPERRIDVYNRAVAAPECESVDGGVEHGAILFLTCEQRLLDLDARGD